MEVQERRGPGAFQGIGDVVSCERPAIRNLARKRTLPFDIPKTIAQFKARQPYDTPNLRSYYGRLYEGLRKAGLLEE